MIYTPLTNKAMKIAYQAHEGQVDACGIPYIFHPFHLAEQMTDEATTCAALLHDVAEDTDVTLADLSKEFPKDIVDALNLLTHDKATDYFDYIRAIQANPIAKAVKLADLKHNSVESRFAGSQNVSGEKRAYWRKKYEKAMLLLL